MERRHSVRHARRVQIAYWKQGEPQHSFTGYTTNISVSGMFVGTNNPFPRGSRLRIEVLDVAKGFMVEGIVTFSVKAPQQLQAVRLSGMGVRFLRVDELVANLLQAGGTRAQGPLSAQGQVMGTAAGSFGAGGTGGPAAPAAARTPPTPPPPGPPLRVVPVRFQAAEQFLVVYRRDLQNGEMFIPTSDPAPVGEAVVIELHLPLESLAPMRIQAHVSRSMPAPINGSGSMVLEFDRPDEVTASLRPIAEALRSTS